VIPVLVRRRIEMLDGIDPHRVHDLGPPAPSTHALTTSELPGAALALARKAWRLRALAHEYNAPLISTFLHKSHIIALTAKLLLDRRLRVVLNVHELLSQHIAHHFLPPQRRIMQQFVRRYFPRSDAIVAVAEGIKDDLVRNFGLPANLISVVRNPLDLTLIRERAREPIEASLVAPDTRLVLAVSRLVALKGIDYLLHAFANLPPALNAQLIVLGTGDQEGSLIALAARLGLDDRVRFLGQQENPWKYMARADVLALPSLTEGFPNVIGEALALGVPVVATDCSPGVHEYLEDGAAGLLVPPADAEALRAALVRVLTNAELRKQLSTRGLERVRPFELPAAVQAYERILENAHGASQVKRRSRE
jgi:glycosyltransferase involved in cell wall biosynthesis